MKTYIYNNKKYRARSKDEVLRRNKINPANEVERKKIVKIKLDKKVKKII